MKILLSILFALMITTGIRANPYWRTNYSEALQKAKAENKLVILDFTGSDWCGFCQVLDEEVFSTRAFEEFSRDYILVKVDFPQHTEIDPAVKTQNNQLLKQYCRDGAFGFPTLLVVTSDEKPLGRMSGYRPGSGPEAVIGKLKSFSGK